MYCTTLDYSPNLNPSQIPAMPPIADNMTDEKENIPAPHSVGIQLPTVEPIASMMNMSFFRSIKIQYSRRQKEASPIFDRRCAKNVLAHGILNKTVCLKKNQFRCKDDAVTNMPSAVNQLVIRSDDNERS